MRWGETQRRVNVPPLFFGVASLAGLLRKRGRWVKLIPERGGATYDGKLRGSESVFELALLLEPPLPGVLVLYVFFADKDDRKRAGLDVSPWCAVHSNSMAGDHATNRCTHLR
jgi:hypothetical protein